MLSESQVKGAKPKGKKYLLNDGKGLYLRVDPSGRKYWILRYRENERERQLSLGVYPDVSLNEARKKRDELHEARARGELISVRADKSPVNFREAAEQWLAVRMKDKAESYLDGRSLCLTYGAGEGLLSSCPVLNKGLISPLYGIFPNASLLVIGLPLITSIEGEGGTLGDVYMLVIGA